MITDTLTTGVIVNVMGLLGLVLLLFNLASGHYTLPIIFLVGFVGFWV